MFTIFPWVYVALTCFKQLPPNLPLMLASKELTQGLRKLLGAEGDVILSEDNTLDIHDKT